MSSQGMGSTRLSGLNKRPRGAKPALAASPETEGKKRCTKCRLWKWPDQFYRAGSRPNGGSWCAECKLADQNARNARKRGA